MGRKLTKRQSTKAKTLGISTDCAALYMRVSTERQVDEGSSLDSQRERLIAYCKAQDWRVCDEHIYVDAGISGSKTANRPAFQAMMEAAKKGEIRRVVALKLDRLARNVRDFLATVDTLKADGVDLVLIKESFDTSTPYGEFALTMFAAMAQLERIQIAERVTDGRMKKARDGVWLGGTPPFGYVADAAGVWHIDEAAAATVRHIFTEFVALYRHTTLTEIASGLNADKIRTQRGGSWYASTVRYVLLNNAYAGLRQYGNETAVPSSQPAIITEELYQAAQRRLDALKPGRVR